MKSSVRKLDIFHVGCIMIIEIKEDGTWFHGSNMKFDVLRAGSTITQ